MTALRRILLGIALSGLAAPTIAFAADSPKVERAKAEVKQSKKQLKDQKKDLKTITKLVKKWKKAADKDKLPKMLKIDAKMSEWMADELAENREQTREAKQEFVKSGGDKAALKPTPEAKPIGTGNKVKPGPTPDKPPVPKKAKDDFKDAKAQMKHQRNTKELAEELKSLQPKFTNDNYGPKTIARKAKLLDQIVLSAQRDVTRAEKELQEDEAHLDKVK